MSKNPPPATREYLVYPGDWLSTIARDELGDVNRWPDIAALNGLADPDLITPGQLLLLPVDEEPGDAAKSRAASTIGDVSGPWTLYLPRGWWTSSTFQYGRTIPGYVDEAGNPIVHDHLAIDLAIPSGTILRAFAPGRVSFAGTRGGYGGVVEVEVVARDASGNLVPTGARYRFAHAESFLVRVGELVEAGRPLALSGGGPNDKNRGLSTGAHAHLEIEDEEGNLVDPLSRISVQNER